MDKLEQLGRQVRDERVRQYRTVDAARAVARVSRGAWDNVEKGKPAKRLTYNSIETALGWELGYCEDFIGRRDVVRSHGDIAAEVEASDLAPATKAHILEVLNKPTPTPPEPPDLDSETA